MGCLKKAEDSDDYIIRLFEPTGKKQSTVINIPAVGKKEKVDLSGFEIRTLKLNVKEGSLNQVALMEENL